MSSYLWQDVLRKQADTHFFRYYTFSFISLISSHTEDLIPRGKYSVCTKLLALTLL